MRNRSGTRCNVTCLPDRSPSARRIVPTGEPRHAPTATSRRAAVSVSASEAEPVLGAGQPALRELSAAPDAGGAGDRRRRAGASEGLERQGGRGADHAQSSRSGRSRGHVHDQPACRRAVLLHGGVSDLYRQCRAAEVYPAPAGRFSRRSRGGRPVGVSSWAQRPDPGQEPPGRLSRGRDLLPRRSSHPAARGSRGAGAGCRPEGRRARADGLDHPHGDPISLPRES